MGDIVHQTSYFQKCRIIYTSYDTYIRLCIRRFDDCNTTSIIMIH